MEREKEEKDKYILRIDRQKESRKKSKERSQRQCEKGKAER